MTTTRDDALFVDTNVLVFASANGAEAHSAALKRLAEERSGSRVLVVSPQIVRGLSP